MSPTYKLINLREPKASMEPKLFDMELANHEAKKILVFPVSLSPRISCLCPLPTGNNTSIIRNPVIKESFTFALNAIRIPLFKGLS